MEPNTLEVFIYGMIAGSLITLGIMTWIFNISDRSRKL